jgi:co-chaperonin GroES (HSP10)
MKNYRQLIKGLPSKTVIMTVGSFNPPTSVNEMAFKLVDKLVESHNADHIIYVTEDKDNLPIDRKLHFLELMFGAMNFKPLNESNLTSELIRLKSKYKDVIVVSSEDKAKLYESMQVVTTSNDLDHSKIKSHVTKGDFVAFKKAMPTTLRELDARRLMNEMRHVHGLELLKEEVKFTVDALREKYFKGQIYHVGDIVESAGEQYEIMDRGSNYLVVVNNTGDLSRKWIKDVSLVEACWTGYKQVGTKKKGSRTVPNCVPESVLNPADPHKDYAEKSKTLQDLSRNKDVDQKAVQQRRLDLDKEYGKIKEEAFRL